MSALIKLLETTLELVKAKLETVDQYQAQIDHIIKAGNRVGAGINEISCAVQNLRYLINDELNQIANLHNHATAELRKYSNELRPVQAPKSSISVGRSRNTTPQQDYDSEGMEHLRGSHHDQCEALRSISEPVNNAA